MRASKIALDNKDTLLSLYAREIAARPLCMMGKNAEVIKLCQECSHTFKKMGKQEDAVIASCDALLPYIECHRFDEAAQVIKDYEEKSGLFDEDGNIVEGMEMYYYTKGLYYLEIGQTKDAEYEFRRLLADQDTWNCREGAYRGLLQLYRKLGEKDSLGKYALLYCQAHDSVYKQMTSLDVIQIESVYDYSRNKLIAEDKMKEVNRLRYGIWVLVVLIVVACLPLLLYHRYLKRVESQKRKSLIDSFDEKRDEMNQNLMDMQGLVTEYTRKIDSLESQLQIEEMMSEEQKSLVNSVESADGLLAKMNEKFLPSYVSSRSMGDEEKTLIIRYMEIKFPKAYKASLCTRLSKDETLLVALCLLDYDDYSIRVLMGSSPSGFANRKSRMIKKMFPEENTKNLRKCIQSLRE